MDINSVNGILRAIVPSLLAYFVGKGWLGADSVADITAATVSIAAAIWSVVSNKPAAAK